MCFRSTLNDGMGRYSRSEALLDYYSGRKRLLPRTISEKESKPISVASIQMHLDYNAPKHHTDKFDLVDGPNPLPILRRGKPFYFDMTFKRPIDFKTDKVKLEFTFGFQNLSNQKSSVYKVLPISLEKDVSEEKKEWKASLAGHRTEISIGIEVHIPATVSVGLWTMKVITQYGNSPEELKYEYKEKLHILFNPWCKEDAVYMEDTEKLKEYVLKDYGKIYTGVYNNISGKTWSYAQFSSYVLPACMYLLERSRLKYTARANPVSVVREISAMVNSQDDRGVLVAKWGKDYEGGVEPRVWAGSEAILKQYYESKGTPVKYGQCWVFAAVTTTICRALGIPTRTVTNFKSGHDADETLTLDVYFDEKGKVLKDTEISWNFHVWNDCWMMRPDLPQGYGGWQAIDATPQEPSQGIYRTGPASVLAIRRGKIGYQYDAPFIFGEVNADIVHWIAKRTENGLERIRVKNRFSSEVGRKILTQKVGVYYPERYRTDDAEDITGEYKYLEGTIEERMAIKDAARSIHRESYFEMPDLEEQDVVFELKDIDKVLIQQPFEVMVRVQNKSKEKRNIRVVLSVNSVYYTGVHARKVKREPKEIALNPNQTQIVTLKVGPHEYMDKLVEYCNMKIYVLAMVHETGQTWSAEDDFMVRKPEMKLRTKGEIKVGREFIVEAEFTNPLETVLNGCSFTIEGPGLTEPLRRKFRAIQPNETIVHREQLIPRKAGNRYISFVFSSRQLYDITGSVVVQVLE